MMLQNLQEVQDFLTVFDGYGKRKILDVVMLLQTHRINKVIAFLQSLYHEKEQGLMVLITTNKTSVEVDRCIACLFRIKMAIKRLEHLTKEDNDYVHTQ